jgi:hypothetical protein
VHDAADIDKPGNGITFLLEVAKVAGMVHLPAADHPLN